MSIPSENAPTRWGAVALVAFGGIVCAVQVGKVAPLLPTIRLDLDLDLATGGMIASGVNLIGALSAAIIGRVADRFGRIRATFAGLGLLALGCLCGALSTTGAMLLVSRVLEGIGFMLVIVTVPGMIVQMSHPKDQRIALGYWGMYLPTGVGLSMLVSPKIAEVLGWRGVWWCDLALTLAYAALLLMMLPRLPRPNRDAPAAAPLRAVLGRPGPWLLGGIFGCYGLMWYALTTWFTTFLVDGAGFSLSQAAGFAALVVIANCIGNFLSGFATRLGFARWIVLAGTTAILAFLTTGIFHSGMPVAGGIALALVFSALGGFVPGTIFASVPAHVRSPTELSVTNGIVVQCTNVGTLLGPPLFAFMVTQLGSWHDARWFLLGIGLSGCALAMLLHRTERQQGIA